MVGMESEGPGMAMALSGWSEAEEVGGVLFLVVVSWCYQDVSNTLSWISRYIQYRQRMYEDSRESWREAWSCSPSGGAEANIRRGDDMRWRVGDVGR